MILTHRPLAKIRQTRRSIKKRRRSRRASTRCWESTFPRRAQRLGPVAANSVRPQHDQATQKKRRNEAGMSLKTKHGSKGSGQQPSPLGRGGKRTTALSLGERVSCSGAFISRSVTGEGCLAQFRQSTSSRAPRSSISVRRKRAILPTWAPGVQLEI